MTLSLPLGKSRDTSFKMKPSLFLAVVDEAEEPAPFCASDSGEDSALLDGQVTVALLNPIWAGCERSMGGGCSTSGSSR